ncbi:hypothetical protein Tco_0142755, partial [Tanacetum coccineum]
MPPKRTSAATARADAAARDVAAAAPMTTNRSTDATSYTLRFQELALMCERVFHEESEEVEKYVGGLHDMIRGNVMSYQPNTIEKAIEFSNDHIDQ